MSAFSQNSCLLWLDFCDSLAQGNEELWHSQNLSFWVGFLAFLWPKVTNNHGVPEIHVFLHRIFGVSLAQSDK